MIIENYIVEVIKKRRRQTEEKTDNEVKTEFNPMYVMCMMYICVFMYVCFVCVHVYECMLFMDLDECWWCS